MGTGGEPYLSGDRGLRSGAAGAHTGAVREREHFVTTRVRHLKRMVQSRDLCRLLLRQGAGGARAGPEGEGLTTQQHSTDDTRR